MILENGGLVGVFTERVLMNRVVVARLDLETAKVSAAMISSITTVPQEPPIREDANLLSQICILFFRYCKMGNCAA